MAANNFVHLHVHSEYSLVDSVIRIKGLITQTVAAGMPAVAMTDVANVYGMVKFYRTALAAGIKPLIGVDAWVEGVANSATPSRLVLLVQDRVGYHNLCSLITHAHRDAQHHGRACLRLDWLREYGGGLIALSGAQQGELGRALLAGNGARVEPLLDEYGRIFPNRFYIELQRVGRPNDADYGELALDLAESKGLPVVATNDVHFLRPEDFDVHEVRVCIQDSRVLNDARRPRRYTEQQYLRTTGEMAELFADVPQALENTLELAKRCNFILEIGDYYLPNFPVPEQKTVEQQLRQQSEVGLAQRFSELKKNPEAAAQLDEPLYGERLNHELEVITHMGFSGYFLIVADFISWAKNNDIPVGPGRGSGAGSLVAYSLGITELDPIEHGLLFERFLNPERVSLPDFDIDFCMEGRDRVIEYVAERYGRDKVSQIITHGTMAARAVVRDVGRVMGMPYGYVDKIAKLIPFEVGMTLDKALDQEELLRQQYEQDDDIHQLLDMARKLEGLARTVGKHAGGVVIAPSTLTQFTPLYCEQGSEHTVTQLDKDDLEAIGLVKFDFLGLRTLTIIDKTVKQINKARAAVGESLLVLDDLPMDDAETYELLRACHTTALFQLESRGMKDLIKRLQPDRFEDLVALVALYRPGPLQSGMVEDFIDRKHGRGQIVYPHPELEPILKPTYGVILYQEQVMEIARVLAGYSLGAADLLRRAMGKKKPEEMARQRAFFVDGAQKRDVRDSVATHIFDLMEKFAGYGFNKSHSAAYALITYQTAWLKAHYPAEFMAASLSADMEHTDKVVRLISECREMGIEVLPPDVNYCNFAFQAKQKDQILYGLGAVKGIGYAVIESIVTEREQGGEFKDLFELCSRVDTKRLNRRALESLIRAGALDGLGAHRAALMATLPVAMEAADQESHARDAGQSDFFGVRTSAETVRRYREVDEWSEEQRLAAEKETLGLYLSGHPIDRYHQELEQLTDFRLADLNPSQNRSLVVAGLVVALRIMNTKRGDRMAFVTLDDNTARLEIAVFSDLFSRSRDVLRKDSLLVVQGQVSVDDFAGGFRMSADSVFSLEQIRAELANKLIITLDQKSLANGLLDSIKTALQDHLHGSCPVVFHYLTATEEGDVSAGDSWRVQLSGELLESLDELVGHESVRIRYRRLPPPATPTRMSAA
ncbi:MAG: DNA polymerase III subunit alpha [Gammaproteobacteria bacterium]|nr:DNA polymerase III subunit alpha [Gammaproteobacteria bacterium]